jgi:hypothetical protein
MTSGVTWPVRCDHRASIDQLSMMLTIVTARVPVVHVPCCNRQHNNCSLETKHGFFQLENGISRTLEHGKILVLHEPKVKKYQSSPSYRQRWKSDKTPGSLRMLTWTIIPCCANYTWWHHYSRWNNWSLQHIKVKSSQSHPRGGKLASWYAEPVLS